MISKGLIMVVTGIAGALFSLILLIIRLFRKPVGLNETDPAEREEVAAISGTQEPDGEETKEISLRNQPRGERDGSAGKETIVLQPLPDVRENEAPVTIRDERSTAENEANRRLHWQDHSTPETSDLNMEATQLLPDRKGTGEAPSNDPEGEELERTKILLPDETKIFAEKKGSNK